MAGVVLTAGPALASTFGATELSQDAAILSQFNLVDLGNFSATAGQTIQGRVLVGGNATFSGSAETICSTGCTKYTSTSVNGVLGTSTAPFGALTVFGSVFTGANGITTNAAGGSVAINGALAGTVNLSGSSSSVLGINSNGTGGTVSGAGAGVRTTASSFNGKVSNSGTVSTSQSLANVFPYASTINGTTYSLTNTFTNPLTDLSRGIAALPGSPGVTAQSLPNNSNVLLTAGTDYTSSTGKTYGVVTTTADNLASATSFAGVSDGSNAATFVIVTGQLSGTNKLPTLSTAYANVLYDFVDATSLSFTGQWNASILAPLATISSEAGQINGTVIVAAMTQTQALNVGNVFTGDLSGLTNASSFRRVPEPASLALISVGLAAAAATRRRKK